jgi:hypothetical protein
VDTIHLISLAMGASWASGINLYATICTLGFMGLTGNIDLPPDLQILSNPLVLAAAGFMYVVEFFTDKIPGVDTLWDALHTFIRIPAGAMLAAGTVGELGQGAELAALLLGGGIATSTHLGKSGSRVLINTSPEPVTNWTASIGEDIAVIGGLWTALQYPWLFLVLFIIFVVLLIWLLPKIWRGIVIVFRKIRALFTSNSNENIPPPM